MTADEKVKEEKESLAKAGKVQKTEAKKETKPEKEAKESEAEGKEKVTEKAKVQSEEPKKDEAGEEIKPEGEAKKKPEKKTDVEAETEGIKAELTKRAEEVVKTIESMTILELANLVKALEKKFGVAAVPAAMAASVGGVAPGGAKAESSAEEKTTLDVILSTVGDKKIQVIKEIRTITSLGLKEAKDLVEQAPKPVKEGILKEEAEEIKKKLEAVGATVELK